MLFNDMFQLWVAIPPVGLIPVELLPIGSVTDQDMFFEQGNRLVLYIVVNTSVARSSITMIGRLELDCFYAQ